MSKLGDIAFVTKLAGFEHTTYIQGKCTHAPQKEDDIPLFIGKTVRDGRIDKKFDWYISKEISDKLERSKLYKKCIVLPYVGSVGDLAIFDGTYKAHLGSNIAKIELLDESKYLIEYVYYFLKSPFGQSLLLKDIQGAVQKNITMEAIRNVEIPDCSLEEQQDAIKVLSLIDKKIDCNNRINSNIKEYITTIYRFWFDQFEFPNLDGKPYKSNGGPMCWNDVLSKSLPLGWEVKPLHSLIKNVSGQKCIKAPDYKQFGKYPIVDQASDYITGRTDDEQYLFDNKDECVVFGDVTTYFKYINFDFAKGTDGTKIIQSKDNSIPAILFYYLIRDAQLPNIGFARHFMYLKDYPVVAPDKSICKKFREKTKPFTDMHRHNVEENYILVRLKNILIPFFLNKKL